MDGPFQQHAAWIEVARTRDRRTARHQALVLQSLGIAAGSLDHAGEVVLVVREADAARAADELHRYQDENASWPPRETHPAPVSQGIHAAIAYVGLITLLFTFQVADRYGLDWTVLGRADAAAIRGGEWWRAATALTLHADIGHLAGNAVLGAVLGVILAQSIGVGLAWWAVLVSGTLGNLANAYLQAPSHLSIGASTAVFGALGVQVAYEWMRRKELGYRPLRLWAPVVMGLGLLAWLGAGGAHADDPRSIEGLERIDIAAHGLGFVAGAAIGLALGQVRRSRFRMSAVGQAWVTSAALLAVIAVWTAALAAR